MGSDDIVVGKSSYSRTAKTVIVEKVAKSAGASTPAESSSSCASPQERHCGAMSQQPFDGGMTSTPQKFLHLVGCRERKSETKPVPQERLRRR